MLCNRMRLSRAPLVPGSQRSGLARCRAAHLRSQKCDPDPQASPEAAIGPQHVASVLAVTCAVSLLSAAAAPSPAAAWLGAQGVPPTPAVQQHQQKHQQQQAALPAAPALLDPTQQPQQQDELLQLAAVGEPRPAVHWLLQVLGIGALNIAGLWAVLRVMAWSKDAGTPVTVLRIRAGLRVDGQQLTERLRFLRSAMMPVEHGMFVCYEEAMQAILQPPRGSSLAYADLSVTPLRSKHDGYELFRRLAAVEQVAADAEEAAHVRHGQPPQGVQHRSPLQRLMGAAETQDAEESQACVVVSLVLLARGAVALPDGALRDAGAFRSAMKQLSSRLSAGQLLGVELLLTPDSPSDFLSEAALLETYPHLTDLATGRAIAGTTPAAAADPAAAAGYDISAGSSSSRDGAADAAGQVAAAAAGGANAGGASVM